MILMDDEVICENEIGYTGQVHLKQACGFVATIPNKPFIAPDGSIRLSDVGGQIRKGTTPPRRAFFLEDDIRFICRLIMRHFVDFSR